MKRKLLFVISLFLCSLLLVNVAGATWSLSSSSGAWIKLSDTEWQTSKDKLDYDAVYTKSGVNIATSWVFALTVDQDTWFDWREFWIQHDVTHTVTFNLTNLGKKISVQFWGKTIRNFQSFGVDENYFEVRFAEDDEDYEVQHAWENNNDYRCYFLKKSATVLNITVAWLFSRNGTTERGGLYSTDEFTVPNGWFDSLDLTQKMIKDGDGWIHGYKDDETFDVYTEPFETRGELIDYFKQFVEALTVPLYSLLPDWARAIIDVFSGIGLIFVNTILPNIAVLLSAYIIINIGLGFQNLSDSLTEMSDLNVANFKDIILDSFKPLYDLFLWIINFVTRIAQIIADVLPF